MIDEKLLEEIKIKELELNKLKKLEKLESRKTEDLEGLKELKRLKEARRLKELELKELEELRRLEELKKLNDVKVNILHTREGLQRRKNAQVIMSEGNYFRLINAFMYFADYTNKDLCLLDIGAREGWFLEFLEKAGYKDGLAIEVCPEAVEIIKDRGLRVLKMDVQKMEFIDEFGTITAIHVLEHCSNPDKVVDNIYRALKKEGILYLEIPLESNPFPMKSAHFSSFPEAEDLFILFNDKWKIIKHEVVIMNKAGSKRTLRSVWRKVS